MSGWTRRAFIATGLMAGGALAVGVGIRSGDRLAGLATLVAEGDEILLDAWVKIAADNTVTAIVPHAEMGQGIHTTLAMMLADEMDADWSLVKVLEAPARKAYANDALAKGHLPRADELPDQLSRVAYGLFRQATQFMNMQTTGASVATSHTGQYGMRVAGAAARTVLLQAAAETWQVPVDELVAQNSYITHTASSRSAPFSDFAVRAAHLKLPLKPRLKDPSAFKIMGTSPARFNALKKVTGQARYGIDVVLPGMKVAAIKAPPVFGSRIQKVEEKGARAVPGVCDIVNLGDVVAVIADGYWPARTALHKLDITFSSTGYESYDQRDILDQMKRDLDAGQASGRMRTDFSLGDIEHAFALAHTVVLAEYQVPFLAHAAMEPLNCTAWVRDGRCELWLGTQNPLRFAAEVADALDLPIENVTVHNHHMGGGFGRRAISDYAIQAARIAATVPYPIKLIWSREDDIQQGPYRQASISRCRAALDSKGLPLAWENHYVNKHVPKDAAHIPYRIANQRVQHVNSDTHVPLGSWFAVDCSQQVFFSESFIDELAIAGGNDPYQYRRHLLAEAKRYRDVLDLAAERADWGAPLPENWGRGIAIHQKAGTIVAQVAEVEMTDSKIRVHRVVCAIDPGFAIHPDGVAAQMECGVAFGLTAALFGEIAIKQGAALQSNFHDYRMLRMNEAPLVETHIINSGAPVGGVGETGLPAIAPAVANAIYDATGVRLRSLPLRLPTPDGL